MTFFGKIFVVLNLTISLLMAAFAMGLYTSGIDWTERAAKGSQPAGLTAQRKSELKEAMDSVVPVEKGYDDANEELMKREEDRQADQRWFAAELKHNRFDADAGNPARDIDLQENGIPKADPKVPRRPLRAAAKDRRGQDLLAVAKYDALLKKAQAENERHLMDLALVFNEDTKLTALLVPPKGVKGGLRGRIEDERIKRQGIKDETEAVEHLATKAAVEAAVIGERIEMLDEQIAALRRALSRLKGMDVKK
jgi:hypothetical protein